MRQTAQAIGGVRASTEPHTRPKAGTAPRPPCILGCINRKTKEPRPAKPNDTLCRVCSDWMEEHADQLDWLETQHTVYASWASRIERTRRIERPKKHTKRGKH